MSSKLVLVLNCGSSSLKFAILDAVNGDEYLSGLAECFHLPEARIKWKMDGSKQEAELGAGAAHSEALNFIVNTILAQKPELSAQLTAIGHRIVHGGEKYTSSVVIDESVIQGIKDAASFAPLHNPANLEGVLSIEKVLPGVPQVTVFDTSFHMTMPEVAYTYALPKDVCDKYHVRKYGAHGTSHRYEWMMAKEILGSRCHRLLSCHLGNGASLAAIEDGVCRDTTMGLTPLDGLMMGTRCGSIDPATVCYLQREGGYSYQEVDDMMNKQSGLLAISGISNDARDIRTRASEGDERCLLAFDMFAYKAMQQAGSMIASMAGVDTITFTAGIGENDWSIRKAFCDCFEWLGVRIDNNKNREAVGNGPQVISSAGSSVTVMVIPTDEEYMIAHDVERLTANN